MVKKKLCVSVSREILDDINYFYENITDLEKKFYGYRNIQNKSQFVAVVLKREIQRLK